MTTAKTPAINPAFKNTGFTRTIYDIVRYAGTADHIPAYLEKFLGRQGLLLLQQDRDRAPQRLRLQHGRDLWQRFLTPGRRQRKQ